MKIHTRQLTGCLAATFALLLLSSCLDKGNKKTETPATPPSPAAALDAPQHRTVIEPALLPSRFQQTGYMIKEDTSDSASGGGNAGSLDGLQLKVGANISTVTPIPLREAMKAIARTKNMSLSWAPDVDQELLVDIDVKAEDNFYEAVDNILRQLDYFQEAEGSTLVIKYRETKQYHVAMPFIKQNYKSSTGSNAGAISSDDNKFDIWENIQKNIDSLVATWSASVATPEAPKSDAAEDKKGKDSKKDAKSSEEAEVSAPLARRVSSTDSSYTIDKPVGLITVHAPKSLQKKIADYLARLEKELYKQIVIEAKIIEVQLNDSSSLGINWNMLLNNLSIQDSTYKKTKDFSRDSGEDSKTKASTDYTDSQTDISNALSSSEDRTQGSSNLKDSTFAATAKTGENIKDNTSTFVTGDGKNLDNLTESKTNSKTENKTGSSSDSSLTGTTSSLDSNSTSSVRTITDALSMGTSAATFITSAGGITEAMSSGVTLLGFNFTSFIKALQEQGQTSVLSNPKISVMNGQPALISVGKNVTYIRNITTTATESGGLSSTVTVDSVLSGIGLALSAVVKDDNEIVMNLVPITAELREPVEYVEVGQGNKIGLPIVNKREISTTVKIKDGSMLVVGGLIKEANTKDGSFLPGAKDIPYLKYLFGYESKSTSKNELIILLRPRIIN